MYLVTANEMQAMDRLTIESLGIPGRVLMENAGREATRFLLGHFVDLPQRRVGVIAGRGNNGGDGFVIARYLAQNGVNVTVYLLAPSSAVKGDAAANLRLLSALGIPLIELPDADSFAQHTLQMQQFDVWVDAIFGTGLKSEVKGYVREVIDFINSLNKAVVAVDMPSGLHSDTGQLCGTCLRAQATVTFAFAKIGQLLYPGASYTGTLKIVDIGVPDCIAQKIGPQQFLLTPALLRSYFRPRASHTHKGQTGHVLVIAGSTGKTGAAAMTAMSAMRTGAGLVTLAVPGSLNAILESQVLEAMTAPLPEIRPGVLGESAFDAIITLLAGKQCLAMGPGLGQAEETKRLLVRILRSCPVPAVVDADGLNNIAGQTKILRENTIPIVVTPHPGEMARLANTSVPAILQDRIKTARDFAIAFKVHVVLKGAGTVIAHPDGNVYVNATGNSGMASGGMGDVLTGMIASLIGQGFSTESATHAAVYLHGAAADTLAQAMGPFGFLASDVMQAIPGEIKKLAAAIPQPDGCRQL